MNLFKRWNRILGWSVFAVAAAVYLLTMEPSSSLWDCSEFIATSYKLEVGHPPGAPLFMMLARIATLFAPSTHYVPHMVNAMNCLASAGCILFLFWTITHLGMRLCRRKGTEPSQADVWTVLGAGLVGALAYTFTDTFWFSAVEGEVYALSSLFTALVVWLMLKWEEQADSPRSARWIVLIAYFMGLSIGVHILNLLTIPALVFIYYFRTAKQVTLRGAACALLAACAILLFINNLIIPYTVYIGAMFDVLFVNTFGLPVNSGIVFFSLALIGTLGWASWYAYRRNKPVWNTALLGVTMILVGFSSYASVTIRAAANPPMNSNNPDNPHALLALLNRDQYGDRPLFFGAYYSAPPVDYKSKTVRYLGEDGKYSTAKVITGVEHAPEFMHLFPRMWNYKYDERDYKPWAAHRTKTEVVRDQQGEIVRDAQGRAQQRTVPDFGRKRIFDNGYDTYTVVEPTFLENLNFFINYQLSYMYWRYFMWNFVGRQSDIQPTHSAITDGNWLSGIRWIDEKYLGPQSDLPHEIADNKERNTYYFLPFILGLIGLVYQLMRDQRNFSIVMLLFVLTGIALVFYFNTSPNEPRERDYVYAGSFYAFAIWIGLGVMAVRDALARLLRRDGIAAAGAATLLCLGVPTILAAQNWDDHDRSHRTYARDIGWNYLQSTLPNSIILDYGDNDTFPLWFNQEVDGVRTDVRVMNTSYLGGEWYIDEMKTRANESAPVPLSLPRSKYAYANDFVPVVDAIDRAVPIGEVMDFIRSEDPRSKRLLTDGTEADYIPTKRIAIPVNKENAIASGIVREEDRALMVDTVYMNLRKSSLEKNELIILDLLANFDWKRPIYTTQPYIMENLGLLDYLQYDGFSYRLVPILTPATDVLDIGRIDPAYTAPLLLGESDRAFRYGNLADPRVYADYFIQYNLGATHARNAFARVAKEYLRRGDTERAMQLLDRGLEVLPTSRIRFTESNTTPYLEAYYAAGILGAEDADAKGDALMREYIDTLIEYIEYYLRFDGIQADMVNDILSDKYNKLWNLYDLAVYAGRHEIVNYLNAYLRTLGVTDAELTIPGAPASEEQPLPQADAAASAPAAE